MLLFLVIPLLGVLAIVADVLRFRRLRQQHRRIAPLRMLWCGATDLIPVAVPLAGLVVSDNTTGYMAAVMWLVWIWMLTVLPRLVYYIFRLLHLRRTGIVIACGIIAALIWGATLGRTGVHVSRVEVCSPRLPAGFDGMRIVQLSDMHLGTIVSPERELTRIVDSVNALRPELVIFTGDLVNIRASELDGRAVRLLRRIEAPVVSVTGNHDVGSYIKDTVSRPANSRMPTCWPHSGRWGGACSMTRPSTCTAAATASRSRASRSTPRCANSATTATWRPRTSTACTPACPTRSTT